MKILVVFEYKDNIFGLTAIDSHKIAYAGNMTISNFEITRYADIFEVYEAEDKQKFDKSGLDLKDFIPISDNNRITSNVFSDNVIKEILEWANAKRAWVYRSQRMTGPDRAKFEKFWTLLEWQNG